MSYAHTKRRKLIKHLKKNYPTKWYTKFSETITEDVIKRLGEPLGTLAEIFKEINKWQRQ